LTAVLKFKDMSAYLLKKLIRDEILIETIFFWGSF